MPINNSCFSTFLSFIVSLLPDADSLIVILIGASVASIEILTRYYDELKLICSNYATWIYIIINSIVSFFILKISKTIDLEVNIINTHQHPYIYAVIIAFSAMAILRSTLINIQVSNHDVVPGLNLTINKLLKWVDRTYDRQRSCHILKDIEPIAKNIPFDAIGSDILLTCMAAMDGISENERNNLLKSRSDLDANGSLSSQAKSNHLAIAIAKITGVTLLKNSIDMWRRTWPGHDDDVLKESLLVKSKRLKQELFGLEGESNDE